jgi:hypothetical protein
VACCLQVQMICLCGVCISFSLFVIISIAMRIQIWMYSMLQVILGSFIPTETVIISMCFTPIRVLMSNTIRIRFLALNYVWNYMQSFFPLYLFACCWMLVVFLQIIHVNLTQDSPKPLEVGRKLEMTYSVKWTSTNVTFAHRFDVYLDYPFFEHQVGSGIWHPFIWSTIS